MGECQGSALLVRNGLAGLESERPAFWEMQAARLVDAQAPGLAGRVRRLAGLPGSRFACTPDLFPSLMAAAIQCQDLGMWAARNGIVTARAEG